LCIIIFTQSSIIGWADNVKKYKLITDNKNPDFGNFYSLDEGTGKTNLLGNLLKTTDIDKILDYEVIPRLNIIIIENYDGDLSTLKIVSLTDLKLITTLDFLQNNRIWDG